MKRASGFSLVEVLIALALFLLAAAFAAQLLLETAQQLTDAGMTRLLPSGTRDDVVTPGDGVRQTRVLAENATVVSVVTPEPDRDDSPLARQNTPLVLVSVPDEQAPHVAAAALGSPVTVTLR